MDGPTQSSGMHCSDTCALVKIKELCARYLAPPPKLKRRIHFLPWTDGRALCAAFRRIINGSWRRQTLSHALIHFDKSCDFSRGKISEVPKTNVPLCRFPLLLSELKWRPSTIFTWLSLALEEALVGLYTGKKYSGMQGSVRVCFEICTPEERGEKREGV